jgi:hypothetical protein
MRHSSISGSNGRTELGVAARRWAKLNGQMPSVSVGAINVGLRYTKQLSSCRSPPLPPPATEARGEREAGLLDNIKIYKGIDNLWYPFNAPGGPFKTREKALAAYWYHRDLISGKSDKKSDPRWAMGATE